MREKTIGKLLQEARIAKHLTLEEIEEKTAIPIPHLLALELGQFELIPKDQIDTYLQQYSVLTDLDATELLKQYHEHDINLLNEQHEETVSEVKLENSVHQVDTIDNESPISDVNLDIGLRSSRYDKESKTNSYLPMTLLCLVALGILAFVSFVTWNQLKNDNNNAHKNYSVVYSESSKESSSMSSQSLQSSEDPTSSSSEEQDSLKMSTEGSGNNLTVNLSNVRDKVTVEISLSGADSSWVSVTNSETGESGLLLSSTGTTSYKTTLVSGTTTSLITLGVTEGVTVAINGQKVDTSSLTSTTVSYITINIQ